MSTNTMTCGASIEVKLPPNRGDLHAGQIYDINHLQPPSLIIQDELHLIEGPLGSMVGLFETAIDSLSTRTSAKSRIIPKYIASSATVRHAKFQVGAVFDRTLHQFPPSGSSVEDNFFSKQPERHPIIHQVAGRLYLGVCAPGRGPQTPVARIWSIIMQTVFELRGNNSISKSELDQFWTLVGYFNARRELGGAERLYQQDMRVRWIPVIASRNKTQARDIPPIKDVRYLELSGRSRSSDLPGVLSRFTATPENNIDAVFCTAMFGTGVDIDRLGLMVVHGQPKTTANYIQATGRIGRQMGGLVITFLRSSRPRDLDHYEYFVGYHRALHRYVEPITVYPFSPSAMNRALGPMCVALLRNSQNISGVSLATRWAFEDRRLKKTVSDSRNMKNHSANPEIIAMLDYLENRAQGNNQPVGRKPQANEAKNLAANGIERWRNTAQQEDNLLYYEPTYIKQAHTPVVLGDAQHETMGLSQVYRNAPQSLRDVEPTTTIE